MKRAMASSLEAKLKQQGNVQVEMHKGGFGEFSVTVDGEKVVKTNRLLYPNPSKVMSTVLSALGEEANESP